MSELPGLTAAFQDHRSISQAEAKQAVQEAADNHVDLTVALEHDLHLGHGDAVALAHQITDAASLPPGQKAVDIAFPLNASLVVASDSPRPPEYGAEPGGGPSGIDSATAEVHLESGLRDLSDPAQRQALLESCPQVSNVSGTDLGNHLCGGAAFASAVILDSVTPQAAADNAKAIRDITTELKQPLTPEEDRALTNLANRQMTKEDMATLQILMQKMMRGRDVGKGVSPGSMAQMLTVMRDHGGLTHSNMTFHMTNETVKGTGKPTQHWTVTVDGVHVNTWPNDGKNDKGVVGPPPPGIGDQADDKFRASIKTTPNGVTTTVMMSSAVETNEHFGITFSVPGKKGRSAVQGAAATNKAANKEAQGYVNIPEP